MHISQSKDDKRKAQRAASKANRNEVARAYRLASEAGVPIESILGYTPTQEEIAFEKREGVYKPGEDYDGFRRVESENEDSADNEKDKKSKSHKMSVEEELAARRRAKLEAEAKEKEEAAKKAAQAKPKTPEITIISDVPVGGEDDNSVHDTNVDTNTDINTDTNATGISDNEEDGLTSLSELLTADELDFIESHFSEEDDALPQHKDANASIIIEDSIEVEHIHRADIDDDDEDDDDDDFLAVDFSVVAPKEYDTDKTNSDTKQANQQQQQHLQQVTYENGNLIVRGIIEEGMSEQEAQAIADKMFNDAAELDGSAAIANEILARHTKNKNSSIADKGATKASGNSDISSKMTREEKKLAKRRAKMEKERAKRAKWEEKHPKRAEKRRAKEAKRRKKKRRTPIWQIIMLVAGLALLAYPIIADRISAYQADQAIEEYTQSIPEDPTEINRLLDQAKAYNDRLSGTPNDYKGTVPDETELIVPGRSAFSWIEFPTLGEKLPIYHGTEESSLQAGVGHLERTSVPIGGASTHTVLTGHSGMPGNRMFDDIDRLEIGDVFFIHTLNQDLAYQVISTEVVWPTEIDSLVIQPGRDLVTLITCTPYGVNSHRLLVHAERTDYDEALALPTNNMALFFNQRTIPFIAAIIAICLFFFFITLHRRHKYPKELGVETAWNGLSDYTDDRRRYVGDRNLRSKRRRE